MNAVKLYSVIGCLLIGLSSALAAEDGPDVGAHSPSQCAADAIREFSGSDGAFLAAGLLKKSFKKDDLATLLEYPTNTIVVLSLTAPQLRAAFERSVSLYPEPSEIFLQISGFEVTFRKNGTPNNRIVSITVNGSKLEETKSYSIAMPSSLAHGGLGYFKIWENAKTVKTFDKTTIEQVLQGKKASDTSPRWLPVA
ncbi:MAG: 5'-nucleotidase [Fimbriimonas sp.]|nr:5'-nucleotidase [Fimbriimonas sp.]